MNARRSVVAAALTLAFGGLVLSGEGSTSQPGRGLPTGDGSPANQLSMRVDRSQLDHSTTASAGLRGNPRVAVAAARSWLDSNRGSTNGHGSADFRVRRISLGVGAGQTIVRFDQTQSGVDVAAGQVVLAVNAAGKVVASTAETMPGTLPSLDPHISPKRAAAIAVAAVAEQALHGAGYGIVSPGSSPAARANANGMLASPVKLAIYDPALIGDPRSQTRRLVWRMTVSRAGAVPVRRDVFIDALNGAVVNSIQVVAGALSRRVCDAASRAAQVPCTNPVRTEGSRATSNADVNLAYDYAGDTWSFYKALGRDSLDGKGMRINSTVRFCPSQAAVDCPFENAYWDGAQMIYGENYAKADDVVAHELTHGVTQYSSNLFYYYQSGAINEGLSDVLGEFVDLTNGHGTDTAAVRWKIGEDLPSGPIRDMADPTAFKDPDRTSSANYDADPKFEDDGGVHANSGIVNKTAYLMTDGGTFNGQTIIGVGISKASKIWYQASQLLTSGSDFRALANTLDQACSSLVGANSITSSDCDQVQSAGVATELRTPPAKAPTPQAAVCDTGSPSNAWSDSFEAGPSSRAWLRSSSIGPTRWYWGSEKSDGGLYATDGADNLWADDTVTRGDTTIAMASSVAVPVNAWLRFDHSWEFEVTDGANGDGGRIEYSTNNGSSWVDASPLIADGNYNGSIYNLKGGDNPLQGMYAFVGSSLGYVSTRLDLSTLAGKSVRFRFRMATDSGNGKATYYGWHIDQARIYTCAGAADTTAPSVSSFALSSPVPGPGTVATNATTLSYSLTLSEPVAGLEPSDFRLTGSSTGWAVASVDGKGSGPYAVTLSGESATDGSLGVALLATTVNDASLNSGPVRETAATQTVKVDRTPPNTTFASSPPSWLRATAALFKFAGADPGGSGVVSYECTLGAFVAAPDQARSSSDACAATMSFAGLVQGQLTLLARAVDAAGNVDLTPASSTFTVDTIAPETSIISGPTKGNRPAFTFGSASADAASYQCRFDSSKWAACKSPCASSKALKRGSHTFGVRAVDTAGNVDASPAVKSFRV